MLISFWSFPLSYYSGLVCSRMFLAFTKAISRLSNSSRFRIIHSFCSPFLPGSKLLVSRISNSCNSRAKEVYLYLWKHIIMALESTVSWCHLPFFIDEINDDRDQPLRPKDRRIYTGDLESRHEEYKAKKASLPKEEFDAWVVKTIKDHEEARRQVGSLSEYLWLKNTCTYLISVILD